MPALHPLNEHQPRYGYQPLDRHAPPVVSVITPYYNTGAIFLETAITLLRQSLQQWEWIIINDGSTDAAALQVLLPFRCGDPRIRVIDTPNQGMVAARNTGIDAARADLIFFLDSDDLLAPTALEQLVWTLISHPGSSFATSWIGVFGAESHGSRRGFASRHAFLYDNTVTMLCIVRRTALLQVGGLNSAMRAGLEDYELWMRMAAAGMWGHDIAATLIWVRRKQPSAYPGYRWDFQQDRMRIPRFRQAMQQRYPDLFRHGLPTPVDEPGPWTAHALVEADPPFANRLLPQGQRRVLMILPAIEIGGADRFVLDLARGLIANGDAVSVVLTRSDQPHAWLHEFQRITSDIFDLGSFLRPGDIPRFVRGLIESRAISHVWVSNSILGYQLLPFLRAYCPDIAVLDYNHLEQPFRHGGWPQAGVEHRALIDLHLTASGYLREWMIARGAEPERVEVCTINVDAERWHPDPALRQQVRHTFGFDQHTFVVLIAARLSAQKRIRFAAEILAQLRDRGVPFVALIAGDGEDMPWLRGFVRRQKLDQIHLLGAQSHARVRELMAAADLFFLPSESEGIALSIYEAMAMGLPVVAADVGGQRELVTPETGILIAATADQQADYLHALVALAADPARRQTMATAARARVVQHFQLPQMVARMQALLDQASMLASTTPRPRTPPGVGLAMAILAIEHATLEQRLRSLLPVRLALKLRHASFAQALLQVIQPARVGVLIERLDRQIYRRRRQVMALLKRLIGRHANP
ncbi:MAG: hypothetical protein Fur005_29360 [Roseiflexaceae bacterium]